MQYQGGKSRLAKHLVPFLVQALDETGGEGVFIEPFVGGFNIVPALPPGPWPCFCSDRHPGLISLYRALREGWQPPRELREGRYAELRAANDWTNPETAFAAFGCSFGAKEWGGYARNRRGDSYASWASASLLRKAPHTQRCWFFTQEYRAVHALDSRHVVYADPPYLGTTQYRTPFDHTPFYAWCEARAAEGAAVFVSEFTSPARPGWEIVWQRDRQVQINQGSSHVKRELLLRVSPCK
jgi:site-specific DNA-adenine methylase